MERKQTGDVVADSEPGAIAVKHVCAKCDKAITTEFSPNYVRVLEQEIAERKTALQELLQASKAALSWIQALDNRAVVIPDLWDAIAKAEGHDFQRQDYPSHLKRS